MNSLFAIPEVLQLNNQEQMVYSLNNKLEIFEDKSLNIKIEDLIGKNKQEYSFFANNKKTPNFGFTDSAYWARFIIKNNTSTDTWYLQLAYPLMDQMDFYEINSDNSYQKKTSGDQFKFSKRDVKHRTILLRFNIAKGEEKTFYVRFKTSGAMEFPLNLLTQKSLQSIDHKEQFIFGLYYGIVLILAFYNFILFFIVRDASYLYYFFYISGYGCLQFILNGLAFEYLWPDFPWWANHSLTFMIGWTFFWSLQFTRSFLDTKNSASKIDGLLIVLMGLMGALMILSLLIPYAINIVISAVLVLLFSMIVIFTGVIEMKKGSLIAQYFLLAWVALLFGVSIYALKGFGVLPATFFTEYGLQIGSIIEMSLLSMGLGARINKINKDNEEAKRKTLEVLRLNEQAQKQLARVEIELLKQNIQPHFLLNSINATIIWLQDDPVSASKLLESLADELRILLDYSKKDYITLHEELNLCRLHLNVMSLRHDKKFTLEVENITGKEKIPPLILHTLVENGLTHGFSNQEKGIFRLTKTLQKNKIIFTFFNDGQSKSHTTKQGSGLGYEYIESRLNELYGEKWSMKSGTVVDGWQVIIEVPI